MSVRSIEAEVSIKSGVQAECTIGREVIRTVYDEPVLESLSVTENGLYEPSEGIDGYSDVTVNVPGKIPVLEQLRAIANGEYYPAEGVDGFDEVLVDVPTSGNGDRIKATGSFTLNENRTIYTLDTKNTEWTHLLIIPHSLPYEGNQARAITMRHVDLENNVMVTAFGSSSGQTYTSASLKAIAEGGECEVTDGVVSFSGELASVGRFTKGIQYDWYAWSNNPEPQRDPNVIEGEFTGTEAGVLTIDLPYTGDSYPKAVFIYDAEGIIKEDVPRAYTMTAFSALKNNAQEPTYDGDTANNGFRYQVVYTGTVTYTSTAGSPAYIFTQADPVIGATNCIKMPDNKTLKVYVSSTTSGSSTRFRVGIRYKYQVFY